MKNIFEVDGEIVRIFFKDGVGYTLIDLSDLKLIQSI